MSPTFGCLFPSGVPPVLAWTGAIETPRAIRTMVRSARTRVRIGSSWKNVMETAVQHGHRPSGKVWNRDLSPDFAPAGTVGGSDCSAVPAVGTRRTTGWSSGRRSPRWRSRYVARAASYAGSDGRRTLASARDQSPDRSTATGVRVPRLRHHDLPAGDPAPRSERHRRRRTPRGSGSADPCAGPARRARPRGPPAVRGVGGRCATAPDARSPRFRRATGRTSP